MTPVPVVQFGGHRYLSYCEERCQRLELRALPWVDDHGARRLALLGCGHTAIQYPERTPR